MYLALLCTNSARAACDVMVTWVIETKHSCSYFSKLIEIFKNKFNECCGHVESGCSLLPLTEVGNYDFKKNIFPKLYREMHALLPAFVQYG